MLPAPSHSAGQAGASGRCRRSPGPAPRRPRRDAGLLLDVGLEADRAAEVGESVGVDLVPFGQRDQVAAHLGGVLQPGRVDGVHRPVVAALVGPVRVAALLEREQVCVLVTDGVPGPQRLQFDVLAVPVQCACGEGNLRARAMTGRGCEKRMTPLSAPFDPMSGPDRAAPPAPGPGLTAVEDRAFPASAARCGPAAEGARGRRRAC